MTTNINNCKGLGRWAGWLLGRFELLSLLVRLGRFRPLGRLAQRLFLLDRKPIGGRNELAYVSAGWLRRKRVGLDDEQSGLQIVVIKSTVGHTDGRGIWGGSRQSFEHPLQMQSLVTLHP